MPDRPAIRLTGFALLLVAVFGVALAAGRLYGPDLGEPDPQPTRQAAGVDARSHA